VPTIGAPAEAVHRVLRDDLDLDGIPNLNMARYAAFPFLCAIQSWRGVDLRRIGRKADHVASFIGTYMEREANELAMENISKNLADADEYPALMTIHSRCVSMISTLCHARSGENAIGTAATGSSEAVHLGGLAMNKQRR